MKKCQERKVLTRVLLLAKVQHFKPEKMKKMTEILRLEPQEGEIVTELLEML